MPVVNLPDVRLNAVQLPAAQGAENANVVMIHGLATSLAFWFGAASSIFTRMGRVTLYDLRGHGYSETPESGYSADRLADDLEKLLDHLGIGSAHLVAHSFGGMVALCLALKRPERVSSLILADVRIWPVEKKFAANDSGPQWRRLRKAGLTLNDRNTDLGIQVLSELARLQVTRPKAAEAISKVLTGTPLKFMGQRNAMRWLNLLEKTRAYSEITAGNEFAVRELSTLKQPILAMYGQRSAALRSARVLNRLAPNCTFRTVPGAGHFFPLTRPKEFGEMVTEFLEPLIAADNWARSTPAPAVAYDTPALAALAATAR